MYQALWTMNARSGQVRSGQALTNNISIEKSVLLIEPLYLTVEVSQVFSKTLVKMKSLNKIAHRQVLSTNAELLKREGRDRGGWVRTVVFVGCTCWFILQFCLLSCSAYLETGQNQGR